MSVLPPSRCFGPAPSVSRESFRQRSESPLHRAAPVSTGVIVDSHLPSRQDGAPRVEKNLPCRWLSATSPRMPESAPSAAPPPHAPAQNRASLSLISTRRSPQHSARPVSVRRRTSSKSVPTFSKEAIAAITPAKVAPYLQSKSRSSALGAKRSVVAVALFAGALRRFRWRQVHSFAFPPLSAFRLGV